MATRIGMWSAVASRKHTIQKVFPFSIVANEFMLYGSVALGLRNGAEVDVDWAARADIVKSPDGKWRMKFYQVYLVRSNSLTRHCIMLLACVLTVKLRILGQLLHIISHRLAFPHSRHRCRQHYDTSKSYRLNPYAF